MDFTGRHIVITGASTGIGKATAHRIVKAGGTVTLIARRANLLEALCTELGDSARWAAADVADKPAALAALDSAMEQNGPIDGLFLNAGIGGTFAPIGEYSDETFDQVLAVNLKAPFWAIKHVLPGMAERGRGAILITASLAAKRGMAMNAGYVASKHAVLGLARSVAVETAPQGIRCNCVIPGFIETPMLEEIPGEQKTTIEARVPQRRMGSAGELAEVAAFLLSDAASHVTGQDWAVDGGVLESIEV
ncbi:SDR family oxidoreductase [Altericroceibacterium spongiae]|uniref:SDR family oxidoreductase n=1 Tax=Altericroceibacterium spongiae TaxID=2320269 RepID=A0A420ELS1_9SPHN|nr:SDR family NAD(P)-dependent oxidoreductase [Altericroceibacterium spongiae]RKF21639.1 SDR family oxidoreductase [Altericroceibacterium spongiae]